MTDIQLPKLLTDNWHTTAYHIGQMVFLGKLLKVGNWQSLSIPIGDSSKYNKDKFCKDKGRRHFTDDL